jgi:hypothetical protein
MSERRSRISNLYPKSKEWIEKVVEWTKQCTNKTIINSLGFNSLSSDANIIEEIYLFVIARSHIHFTGVELDKQASWASWSQLLEVSAKVKSDIDNPLKKLHIGIRATYPEFRSKFDDKKLLLPDYDVNFSKYKIQIKGLEN